ncbi:RagB/SusD family nutrient uptake outer membrane protein [Mucilaginibacter sp. SMC90]|uniref:RagB/SusD family nutrient uptake outer membrane protein n=1 Tax=Mucilaginibacter sp. SMC90 TaxID=2929803 RepID=UPI001FB349D5|nr:RagB/SusD family nutrient uptake outer membrane protein [Mucilaginibacter sp. SMC90]UOE46881.1 RagB/SusD family nutrient uptake outer membrane protein [Mucilaginibacter sp. SMC90]
MKQILKKYRELFLLALLIVSISGCKKDDSLNVTPKGFLTDEATFNSQSNADLFVNDIYNQLPDINNDYQLTEQYADNSFCGAAWENGQATVRAGSIGPSNVPTGPGGMWDWEADYTKIRKCNVFLQQAAANKAKYTDDWYKQRVAEVTYMRAYFYSLLFTAYGGVPIITNPLNNLDGGDIFVGRATIDETVAFIEADCDAAAAVLPAKATETGRATKGAALTLKGWVELFAASPLVNTGNDVTKWSKAAATNKSVMDMGTYSLFNTTATSYADQFLSANNWNVETIFARGYATGPAKGSHREGYLGPVYVNGVQQSWGNLAPTQGLVDDYSMDNGLPITDAASGYNPQDPYTHREQRFYQSILYDGAPWQGDIFKSRIGGSNQIDLGSTSDITNTGYNARKTLDESITGQTSINLAPSFANYIIFRYAEVLLSYAEAQNEAVGPDASVYDAVNKVRARSSLPAVKAGLTKDQMRVYIHRERRIELAFEDKRWFDIRRWLITTGTNGVLTSPEYGMKIEAGGAGLTYTPVKIFTNTFFERQNWMPIPQTEIDKNKKLVQNPGY